MAKKKVKKFYAIKEGNGVTNLIVNTWDECSKLVLGYNAVYKSFRTKEEAEQYLTIVNVEEVKEKAIKGMEARKANKDKPKAPKPKTTKTKALIIHIPKDIYNRFDKKCKDMEQDVEEVLEDLIKEWIE